MCMIVTIVSLIFLSASKLFIAEVLMEKKSMPDSFWVWGGTRLSHVWVVGDSGW